MSLLQPFWIRDPGAPAGDQPETFIWDPCHDWLQQHLQGWDPMAWTGSIGAPHAVGSGMFRNVGKESLGQCFLEAKRLQAIKLQLEYVIKFPKLIRTPMCPRWIRIQQRLKIALAQDAGCEHEIRLSSSWRSHVPIGSFKPLFTLWNEIHCPPPSTVIEESHPYDWTDYAYPRHTVDGLVRGKVLCKSNSIAMTKSKNWGRQMAAIVQT